jgi:hypothetical protein
MITHKQVMALLDAGKDVWGYSVGEFEDGQNDDNPPLRGPFDSKSVAAKFADIDSDYETKSGESGQINWFKAVILDVDFEIDVDQIYRDIIEQIEERAENVEISGDLSEWLKKNVWINGHLGRSYTWILHVEESK